MHNVQLDAKLRWHGQGKAKRTRTTHSRSHGGREVPSRGPVGGVVQVLGLVQGQLQLLGGRVRGGGRQRGLRHGLRPRLPREGAVHLRHNEAPTAHTNPNRYVRAASTMQGAPTTKHATGAHAATTATRQHIQAVQTTCPSLAQAEQWAQREKTQHRVQLEWAQVGLAASRTCSKARVEVGGTTAHVSYTGVLVVRSKMRIDDGDRLTCTSPSFAST
jgi:hypothetical protein